VVRLGDVCKNPQYGFTASAIQIDTGLKLLRITDIQNQKVYWRDVPCCECSEEELKKYKLEKGDIVIARIGATTGKSYLLP
jgi:type I restriction enzyme S subunit